MKGYLKHTLTALFSTLYLAVGFVSVYHAVNFFSISNAPWLATILAVAFEVGQAAVLFAVLMSKTKKAMPWALMGVLTAVQVIGNIYSSYQYMILNSADKIRYFTDSVLFFVQDPNPQVNQVMISYITGAILPIVALCLTSMVVNISYEGAPSELHETPKSDAKQPEPESELVESDTTSKRGSSIEQPSKIVY